jgi:lysophospholipase L1-like esterase
MRDCLPELIAALLLPWLLLQGRRTRRITPRLPEALGPAAGVITGAGATGQVLRLLTFGESPVAGVGVEDHEQAISGQLARVLATRTQRPVAWRACGRNGVTVGEALHDLLPSVPARPVDLALVAFGVNDTTAFRSVAQWRADVSTLLDALEARCRPGLILLSGVPPVGSFPALPQPLRWVMGLKAGALDRVLRTLAQARARTLYVPLVLDPGDPALMARDGYHPSAAGCSAWACLLGDACGAGMAAAHETSRDGAGAHQPVNLL